MSYQCSPKALENIQPKYPESLRHPRRMPSDKQCYLFSDQYIFVAAFYIPNFFIQLPGSILNFLLRMIRRHMKTPSTKLETVAEIMELEMIKMLSYTVAGSLGCSRMPRMNEMMPATAPDMRACTCIRARLPHTSVSLVSG